MVKTTQGDYKLGDRVRARDTDPNDENVWNKEWKVGTVTSFETSSSLDADGKAKVTPVVKVEGWEKAYTWAYVEPIVPVDSSKKTAEAEMNLKMIAKLKTDD